jgi:NAD(P)-dependent dehydrogenase (short-subunit alcohol dehydrogenase family)
MVPEPLAVTPIRLDDQVVLITGAGRGLGRAYALELAGRGAAIVVNDLDDAAAAATVADIIAAGGTAVQAPGSVAEPGTAAELTRTALQAFGTLDVLINNAGVVSHGYFEDLTIDQIDRVLDLNLRGAFLVTQPAWRVMKAKGYGRVVLTGSGSGMFSHQGTANYAASKAGLFGLMKALAFEGRDHGIATNMILPTAHTMLAADDPIPDYAQHRGEITLIRDPADPVDRTSPEANAAVVAYLASPRCALNGEVIDYCFGRYGRVFVGVTDGWIPPRGVAVTADGVADHLSEIRAREHYEVPPDYYAALRRVAAQLREPDSSTG